MKLTRVMVATCVALFGAAACGEEDADPAVSQNVTVEAFDFYFEPTALTVNIGAEVTVELTNAGSVSHSWTSTDLDAEVVAGSGEEAAVTFTAPTEPGSYDFFCKFHPDEMQGTISIGGADEPKEEVPPTEEEDDDVDVDVDTNEEEEEEDNY